MNDVIFAINGVETLGPSSINCNVINQYSSNSGRSEVSGIYISKMIRKGIRSFDLEWVGLREEEALEIYQRINEGDTLTITIFDLSTGKNSTYEYRISENGVDITYVRMLMSGTRYFAISLSIEQK